LRVLLDAVPLQSRPEAERDNSARPPRYRAVGRIDGPAIASDRPLSILIAGGGIGGLTCALACAAQGLNVRVAERAETFREIGAGIQITPNALRVLRDLGLQAEVEALASKPKALEVRTRRGRRIVTMPLGRRFEKRHALPYLTIHRADLQAVLARAAERDKRIALETGQEVVEFALHRRGLTVMADQASGQIEHAADVLVGADGIRSHIRPLMPGAREEKATGWTAWRALIPKDAFPETVAPDRVGLWLGRDGHIVHYPVRGGAEFNVVIVTRDMSGDQEASHSPKTGGRFEAWGRPIRDLISAAGDGWRAWAIATVRPNGIWAAGPVALLGDAAHAMTPYLAQGGAMAIEDAAVLAAMLAADPEDPPQALQRYQAARQRRVKRVWRSANATADLYHMGAFTAPMRNLIMRAIGGRGLIGRYDWIYRWQPPKQARRPKAARRGGPGEETRVPG